MTQAALGVFAARIANRRAIQFAAAAVVAIILAVGAVALHADQQPAIGPNVNLVGGPTFLKAPPQFEMRGDPLRAQQFESFCVFNARQPLHLFCVSNDNRVVDVTGVDTLDNEGTGDSTIGMYQSIDGGLTWQSQIIPGTRYDAIVSPIKNYQVAADSFAAAAAGGVIHASGIVFNRGSNAANALSLWTFVDPDNSEADPFPAKLVLNRVWDVGSSGLFIDRPTLYVAPPAGGAMATYQVPQADGTSIMQTVPASPIHVGYTVFVGNDNNVRSKVMYSASYDGGFSNTTPMKLSEGYAINQGIQIAQTGAGKLCVVWRRGQSNGTNNEFDANMVACSSDGGRTFTKAAALGGAALCPLDQDTSPTRSRIRAVPSITADASRFYVAWSERPRDAAGACTHGDSRVVVSTSVDGATWTAPVKVDPYAGRGNQINPTITMAASGKLNVLWEDFRNDASGVFEPFVDEAPIVANSPPLNPRRRHTRDMFAAEGQAAATPAWGPSFQVSQYIFGDVTRDRHYKSGEPARQQLQWNPFNVRLFKRMTSAGTSDYNSIATENIVPADPVAAPGSWARNTGQLGDPYIFYSWTDGRNVRLLPNEDYSKPRPYTAPNLTTLGSGGTSLYDPTQNRSVCVPGQPGTKNLDVYGALKTQGVFAGAPGNNKSTVNLDRTFTVFGQNMSSIEKILRFTIAVQPPGGAATMATFNQSFPSAVAGGPRIGSNGSPFVPITTVDAIAGSKNVAVRSVYVPKQPRRPIAVDVSEMTARMVTSLIRVGLVATVQMPNHGYHVGDSIVIAGANQPEFNGTFAVASVIGANSFTYNFAGSSFAAATGAIRSAPLASARLARRVWLNFDPTQPENLSTTDPPASAFNINNFETYNVDFAPLGPTDVQIIDFPKSGSQGWQTPGWETPGWETPGWETPGWETPGWETPGWETPGWETPGWETPGWETTSLSDGDERIQDIRRQVRNNSNTYAAVNLRALVNGAVPPDVKFQGVAYRLYTTPAVDPCEQKLVGNTQVLLNIQNLDVSAANFFSPSDSSSGQNGTVWLGPRETIYFNVRAVGPIASVEQVRPEEVVLKATPQAVGTQDVINHVTTPPPAFSQLSLIAAALPAAQAGVPYSAMIQAVGGAPPYHFTSTELPGGLTLDQSTGAIAGTATTAGAFSLTVDVNDSGSPVQTASRIYVIQVNPGPAAQLAFTAQPSTTATGQPITPAVQVALEDAFGNFVTTSGTPVSIAFGSHPEGATLEGTKSVATINGVASFPDLATTTAGTGFTLVASSGVLTAATSYPFNVIGPLTIETLALPNGTEGAPYSQHTFASGGVPPYVWSIDPIPDGPQFNLPDGLSLTTDHDGTGLISGTPTTVLLAGASFRLRVTDSVGHTTTQDTCIHIDESTSGPLFAAGVGEPGGPLSAQAVADTLVGEGVTISNVVYTGVARALGTFSGGFPATGLSSGIVLSSGAVANLNPPNNDDGKTTFNSGIGDADLDALIPGFTTRDAAILEFDFALTDPDSTVAKFDYVFASEEYNEFVHSPFNDVFGFFISGPGLPKANFALIPGTTLPVSINNVNGGNPFGTNAQHAELFVNNDLSDGGGSIAIQADGLIKVLTLQATVVPGQTYHMKIAVADAGDTALDSWVLLKAHSLSAVCPTIPR